MNDFQILAFDSELFGFKVAKILMANGDEIEFDVLINNLKKENVKLAYWSLDSHANVDVPFAKFGGKLVDLKTTYWRSTDKYTEHNTESLLFFNKEKPDKNLYDISLQCGEYSRFKADNKIPNSVFVNLYHTWIEKSITRELADEIIIYKVNNDIAGMITVYVQKSIGYIGLVGVDEKYRGQGIGSKLINNALSYFKSNGCSSIEVVTQGANKAACSLYEKHGFLVKDQYQFYHFWI